MSIRNIFRVAKSAKRKPKWRILQGNLRYLLNLICLWSKFLWWYKALVYLIGFARRASHLLRFLSKLKKTESYSIEMFSPSLLSPPFIILFLIFVMEKCWNENRKLKLTSIWFSSGHHYQQQCSFSLDIHNVLMQKKKSTFQFNSFSIQIQIQIHLYTYTYIYWFVVINLSNLFTSFEYYYWMEKNTEQNADTVKQCRAVWATIVRRKQIIKPPPIVYSFTKQLSNQQIR